MVFPIREAPNMPKLHAREKLVIGIFELLPSNLSLSDFIINGSASGLIGISTVELIEDSI